MNEIFYLRPNHYNLHNFIVFATVNPRSKYLLNSSVYRSNQLWRTLSSEIKDCASLQLFKDKTKLGIVIDINVRFAQHILPILVTFGLFFLWSKVDTKQNCIVVNFEWPKCPFLVKAMYMSPWVWSNFISYVKGFFCFPIAICLYPTLQ